jgi:hypothetical protein
VHALGLLFFSFADSVLCCCFSLSPYLSTFVCVSECVYIYLCTKKPSKLSITHFYLPLILHIYIYIYINSYLVTSEAFILALKSNIQAQLVAPTALCLVSPACLVVDRACLSFYVVVVFSCLVSSLFSPSLYTCAGISYTTSNSKRVCVCTRGPSFTSTSRH